MTFVAVVTGASSGIGEASRAGALATTRTGADEAGR
jgi:NADP-dependent 3-hydroxy acid dehydrogenase YdfG